MSFQDLERERFRDAYDASLNLSARSLANAPSLPLQLHTLGLPATAGLLLKGAGELGDRLAIWLARAGHMDRPRDGRDLLRQVIAADSMAVAAAEEEAIQWAAALKLLTPKSNDDASSRGGG